MPEKRDGDFARMFLATGLVPLGKTQLSEYGFSPSAEHPRLGRGAHPLEHPAHGGRELGRLGGDGGGGRGADRARERRRRLDPDPGGRQRPRRASSPLGTGSPRTPTMRQMPVRIISDGVVTRSVRDTAAFFREAEKVYRALHLPPIGDLTRPGPPPAPHRRAHRGRRPRREPGGHRADPQARCPARGARPPGRARRRPRGAVVPATTSSSTGRAWRCSSCAAGAGCTAGRGSPRTSTA